MKTLDKIQKLSKIGYFISKMIEICTTIGAICCMIGFILLQTKVITNFKVGNVTIHGLIEATTDINMGTIYTSILIGFVACISEIILAKLAQKYFKKELEVGTPFTVEGADELKQLGIYTIIIPIITLIITSIIYSIMTLIYKNIEPMSYDNITITGLGIFMLFASLLCRLGAEKNGTNK